VVFLYGNISANVSGYEMFAVAKRRQIWAERHQERARYTVLGEDDFL